MKYIHNKVVFSYLLLRVFLEFYTSRVLSLTKYLKDFFRGHKDKNWEREAVNGKQYTSHTAAQDRTSYYDHPHTTTTLLQPFSIKELKNCLQKGINWCCRNSSLFQDKIAVKWDDSRHKGRQKYHWEYLKNKLPWRKSGKRENNSSRVGVKIYWLDLKKSHFSAWRQGRE